MTNAVRAALDALAIPGAPDPDANPFRPCPGPCNTTWRALTKRDRSDVRHDIQPRAADPVWCDRCVAEIRRALHDFAALTGQLEDDKATRTAPAVDYVTGSSAPRSPSAEFDEQDALLRALEQFEDVIRYARRLPRRDQVERIRRAHVRAQGWSAVPSTVGLLNVVDFLDTHLTWALAHDDIGPDLGRTILAYRDRLTARTRAGTPPAERIPEPCERCGLRALVHVEGTGTVECRNLSCRAIVDLSTFTLAHQHRRRTRGIR